MIERILCALLGHRYVTQRVFSPHSRQVGCTRCGCEWGMHDPTRSLVPWDAELESMHRTLGQWPDAADAAIAAHAKRLALELECLLLSCNDTAAVSKWWDSAHEALEQYRADLARLYPQPHVSPLGKD